MINPISANGLLVTCMVVDKRTIVNKQMNE